VGQNQTVSAITTGIEPQTTAQGVKMDETSITDVSTAAINGIEEGPGIVAGDVDPRRIAKVREELPALTHRVL